MISIDYTTYEINVPKVDTVFIGFDAITGREKRSLDVTDFGQKLADLQDNQSDVWAPTAYFYTQQNTVGTTFIAPALNILSPYTITFEPGTWAVYLTNGNSNIQDVSTINGVSVNSSNSSGLVGYDELVNQSYLEGRVFINTTVGTAAGKGTPTNPIDNFPGAKFIADTLRLNGYNLAGNITLDASYDLENSNWAGESFTKSTILFDNDDLDSSVFRDLSLSGTINSGRFSIFHSIISLAGPLTNFDGSMENVGFAGTLTLNSSSITPIIFRNCYSSVAGLSKPMVDCNGVTSSINFRGQMGGLEIQNFNGGGDMSIDADGVLRLKLDSTCTAGTIVVGGIVLLEDNSGPGCTVIKSSTVTELIAANLTDIDNKVDEIHRIQGLDSANPLVTTPDTMDAGDIEIVITGDGETNSTFTRQ